MHGVNVSLLLRFQIIFSHLYFLELRSYLDDLEKNSNTDEKPADSDLMLGSCKKKILKNMFFIESQTNQEFSFF